jgi:hypothetical protein
MLRLFVPGRLCLFGEHSDWAGTYRAEDPSIPPGHCLVTGTDQGLHAEAERLADGVELWSRLPDGAIRGPERVPARPDALAVAARAGGFFSYAAGVASVVSERYELAGIRLRVTAADLPVGKGLSSSAAICVLVARAYGRLYDLGLSPRDEMELAYLGERRAGSGCGRMDQACAFGRRTTFLPFDADRLVVDTVAPGARVDVLLVDLGREKDTRRILADLRACYPAAPGALAPGCATRSARARAARPRARRGRRGRHAPRRAHERAQAASTSGSRPPVPSSRRRACTRCSPPLRARARMGGRASARRATAPRSSSRADPRSAMRSPRGSRATSGSGPCRSRWSRSDDPGRTAGRRDRARRARRLHRGARRPPLNSQFFFALNLSAPTGSGVPPGMHTATAVAPDGLFCPGQRNPGAFGKPETKRIVEVGSPAGDLRDGMPHEFTLAGVPCIGSGGSLVDDFADLPGPNGMSLTGTIQLLE